LLPEPSSIWKAYATPAAREAGGVYVKDVPVNPEAICPAVERSNAFPYFKVMVAVPLKSSQVRVNG